MANNKVQLSDGTVLMDTSGVTVTPEVLMEGYTALDKSGAQITGVAKQGGVVVVEEDDEHGGKVVHITGDVIKTQSKVVTPTKSKQEIKPDADYNALSGVTVNPIPDNYIEPSGTLTITENGTKSVSQYASVNVNVQAAAPTLQEKTATPTESSQEITADSGYDGLSKVTVGAVNSTYVGSGITRNPTPTANGKTVTIPAGYYSAQITKDVATTTHPDPSASVNSSTGLVTASHTQTAGYVAAGTTTGTLQLTTQAAKTVTPTKSEQNAVAAGVYTTGIVKVAAIPAQYITTTDANAAASDIVSGQTAYVNGSKVTGTLVIQHYYTGSGTPSASLGADGDIYLMGG